MLTLQDLDPPQIDAFIRRRNLITAWRLRLEFTIEQRAHLQELWQKEFGERWQEILETSI